ncbi:MAG: hypothetical protein AAF539_15105, partial [Planctomycetota bacterium]
ASVPDNPGHSPGPRARRVELLVPVNDPDCRARLREMLQLYFRDNQNTWQMNSDGSYTRKQSPRRNKAFRVQEALFRNAVEAVGRNRSKSDNTFDPVRS